MRYVRIAVAGPLRKSFTYSLPNSISLLEPGQRVLVPFGREHKVGYYLEDARPESGIVIKSIVKTLENNSFLTPELFKLCTWMADYYFANPADIFAAALPPSMKSGRAAYYIWKKESIHLPFEIRKKVKIGKRLSSALIRDVTRQDKKLLKKLIDDNAIEEIWPGNDDRTGSSVELMPLSFIEARPDVRSIELNQEQQSALAALSEALPMGHKVY